MNFISSWSVENNLRFTHVENKCNVISLLKPPTSEQVKLTCSYTAWCSGPLN